MSNGAWMTFARVQSDSVSSADTAARTLYSRRSGILTRPIEPKVPNDEILWVVDAIGLEPMNTVGELRRAEGDWHTSGNDRKFFNEFCTLIEGKKQPIALNKLRGFAGQTLFSVRKGALSRRQPGISAVSE